MRFPPKSGAAWLSSNVRPGKKPFRVIDWHGGCISMLEENVLYTLRQRILYSRGNWEVHTFSVAG